MYLQLPIPEPPTTLFTLKVFQTTSFVNEQIHTSVDPHYIPKKGEILDLSTHMEYLEATKESLDGARIREITVRVPRNGCISDLKQNVIKLMKWQDSFHDFICADVWQSKIYKILEDNEPLTAISNNDIIYLLPYANCIEELKRSTILSPFISSTKIEADELTGQASSDDVIVSTIHFVNSSSHEGLMLCPMALSLPSLIIFNPPIQREDSALANTMGDLLYRLIVEKLMPFSSSPLYRRRGSGITLRILETLTSTSEMALHISFSPVNDEWECIPDLFEVSVETESGQTVIYPYESGDSPQQPRSPVAAQVDSPDENFALSSPKSDLSDLAHRMERNGSIEAEADELLEATLPPPSKEPLTTHADDLLHSYQISHDLKIRVKFTDEAAKLLFHFDRPSYGSSRLLPSNFEVK